MAKCVLEQGGGEGYLFPFALAFGGLPPPLFRCRGVSVPGGSLRPGTFWRQEYRS